MGDWQGDQQQQDWSNYNQDWTNTGQVIQMVAISFYEMSRRTDVKILLSFITYA